VISSLRIAQQVFRSLQRQPWFHWRSRL